MFVECKDQAELQYMKNCGITNHTHVPEWLTNTAPPIGHFPVYVNVTYLPDGHILNDYSTEEKPEEFMEFEDFARQNSKGEENDEE